VKIITLNIPTKLNKLHTTKLTVKPLSQNNLSLPNTTNFVKEKIAQQ